MKQKVKLIFFLVFTTNCFGQNWYLRKVPEFNIQIFAPNEKEDSLSNDVFYYFRSNSINKAFDKATNQNYAWFCIPINPYINYKSAEDLLNKMTGSNLTYNFKNISKKKYYVEKGISCLSFELSVENDSLNLFGKLIATEKNIICLTTLKKSGTKLSVLDKSFFNNYVIENFKPFIPQNYTLEQLLNSTPHYSYSYESNKYYWSEAFYDRKLERSEYSILYNGLLKKYEGEKYLGLNTPTIITAKMWYDKIYDGYIDFFKDNFKKIKDDTLKLILLNKLPEIKTTESYSLLRDYLLDKENKTNFKNLFLNCYHLGDSLALTYQIFGNSIISIFKKHKSDDQFRIINLLVNQGYLCMDDLMAVKEEIIELILENSSSIKTGMGLKYYHLGNSDLTFRFLNYLNDKNASALINDNIQIDFYDLNINIFNAFVNYNRIPPLKLVENLCNYSENISLVYYELNRLNALQLFPEKYNNKESFIKSLTASFAKKDSETYYEHSTEEVVKIEEKIIKGIKYNFIEANYYWGTEKNSTDLTKYFFLIKKEEPLISSLNMKNMDCCVWSEYYLEYIENIKEKSTWNYVSEKSELLKKFN